MRGSCLRLDTLCPGVAACRRCHGSPNRGRQCTTATTCNHLRHRHYPSPRPRRRVKYTMATAPVVICNSHSSSNTSDLHLHRRSSTILDTMGTHRLAASLMHLLNLDPTLECRGMVLVLVTVNQRRHRLARQLRASPHLRPSTIGQGRFTTLTLIRPVLGLQRCHQQLPRVRKQIRYLLLLVRNLSCLLRMLEIAGIVHRS